MSRLGSDQTENAPTSAASVLLLLCTDCRIKSKQEEDRGAEDS